MKNMPRSILLCCALLFIVFLLTSCPDKLSKVESHEVLLSENPEVGGEVSGEGTFKYGTEVTVEAIPNEDWEFVNWTENSVEVSNEAEYTFTITQNRELVANFTKEFTITVTHSHGGNVIINDSLSIQSYADILGIWDIVITWSVKDLNGFPNNFAMLIEKQTLGEFTGLVGPEGSVPDVAVTGSVKENGEIEFSFLLKSPIPPIPDRQFKFTGSVVCDVITGLCQVYEGKDLYRQGPFEAEKRQTQIVTANYGESITFNMQPQEHYLVDDIQVDWISLGSANSFTFENVDQNHYMHAKFGLRTYTITATAGEGGSISPEGEVEVEHGSNQEFQISPDEGYAIEDVIVDGSSVGPVESYTFDRVVSERSIEARFIKTHIITATSLGIGTIVPSGEVAVLHGSSQSFAMNPGDDEKIGDVLVDGVSVGSVDYYVFLNVTSDHTIHVIFERIFYQ